MNNEKTFTVLGFKLESKKYPKHSGIAETNLEMIEKTVKNILRVDKWPEDERHVRPALRILEGDLN